MEAVVQYWIILLADGGSGHWSSIGLYCSLMEAVVQYWIILLADGGSGA